MSLDFSPPIGILQFGVDAAGQASFESTSDRLLGRPYTEHNALSSADNFLRQLAEPRKVMPA